MVIPRLRPGIQDFGMDYELVAQVAYDDPVRQRARLVDHGRCRDDSRFLSALALHGFLGIVDVSQTGLAIADGSGRCAFQGIRTYNRG